MNIIHTMRVGHGYDVHRFTDGGEFVLGGVTIPYSKSLEAHSDGDVLLHALMDALLGAAALGDIGKHFPDTDERFLNCSSRVLLKEVWQQLQALNYVVANLDCTIIAQAPKMAPHLMVMREHIALDLGMQIDQINIKATTTEKLGYIGRGEGIAVHAVALLFKQEQ